MSDTLFKTRVKCARVNQVPITRVKVAPSRVIGPNQLRFIKLDISLVANLPDAKRNLTAPQRCTCRPGSGAKPSV